MNSPASETYANWLILYDFDGTLTRGDSMLPFLLHAVGRRRFLSGIPRLLARWWRLWRRGEWTLRSGKEALLSNYIAGRSRAELAAIERAFVANRLQRLLRPEVLDQLRAYRAGGATVAVVSASLDLWLRVFCAAENLRLLCTEAAFDHDRFTGRLATPNCKYAEKSRRIQLAFMLEKYDRIVAYGNSRGDHAMFELAHEAWQCDRRGRFRRYR